MNATIPRKKPLKYIISATLMTCGIAWIAYYFIWGFELLPVDMRLIAICTAGVVLLSIVLLSRSMLIAPLLSLVGIVLAVSLIVTKEAFNLHSISGNATHSIIFFILSFLSMPGFKGGGSSWDNYINPDRADGIWYLPPDSDS